MIRMIEQSAFRPAWWLTNPHLQTLWPRFLRKDPPIALEPERIELRDGDFLDLAWTKASDGPIV